MPWVVDAEGKSVYKASIYAKEELPTWYELYEKFWKQTIFNYSVEDDTELDPYWKMPVTKYILLITCNEFNKLLFEDGLLDQLIAELKTHDSFKEIDIHDIRFTCHRYFSDITPGDRIMQIQELFVGIRCAPPIYRIPLPTGDPNPFETEYRRIDAPDGDFSLYPIICGTKNSSPVIFLPDLDSGEWSDIVEWMMRSVRQYFEGGVGWKDGEGKLISDRSGGSGCPAGFDPAL